MNNISAIRSLIDEKDWISLKKELNNFEPFQVADIIESLPQAEQVILFRVLSRELAKVIFSHLSRDQQKGIVESIASNISQVSDLLNDLDPDDRTAFFEELPGEVTQRLLQMLSFKEREKAIKLLGYPKESIGRLMTPEYVAVRANFTVHQTLEHIRKFGRDSETLNVIYVVDNNWKLIDDIRIRDIILAPPLQTIGEISDNRFVALNAFDDREVAVKAFQDNDRIALPVTDTDGTLLGIVTVDDVIDIIQMETTEDFQKMSALAPSHEPYLNTGVFILAKNRILWLMLLMLSATITGYIISSFEDGLAVLPSLIAFIPMLMGTGGNAGAQASTLIIRGMAVGEVHLKDVFKVVWKEIRVGALCGFALGTVNFLRVLLWNQQNALLSLVVTLSLFCTILIAKTIGGLLPILAKKMKIDPAIMAAPLITTTVDATSLIVYFAIAKALLGI